MYLKYLSSLLLVFASIPVTAQQYNLQLIKQDYPELKEDFSTPGSTGWVNVKYDSTFNGGYYYANGKYIIEGEKGLGVFKNFNNPATSGLKNKFTPYSYGYKYVEAEFTLVSGTDTSIRFGLFFGSMNGAGFSLQIKPDGRFRVNEQYYTGKGNETAIKVIRDFMFSDAIKKGITATNKLRAEIEYANLGSGDGKYNYNFFINGKLVLSHQSGEISGADIQFIKGGKKYKIEVDNLSFGRYGNTLRTTAWNLSNAGELAKIMMDESLDINTRKTNLLKAAQPYLQNHSTIETELKIGGKAYEMKIYLPSADRPRISYQVNGFTVDEMKRFTDAYISGLSTHGSVQHLTKSYRILDDTRFPFYTKGVYETRRGVASLNQVVKLTKNSLDIVIDFNKKSFVPINTDRQDLDFHKRVREILELTYDFENYKGRLFEKKESKLIFMPGTEFYTYTGPVIKEITYQHFIRKRGSYSYGDRYDLGAYIVDGKASTAKEEYGKWIHYIAYALGKDYVMVPLTEGSSGRQLVTNASKQSIAFRNKDLADSRYIKLELDGGKLLVYFSTSNITSEIDNDSYEQSYY